MRYLLLLLTLIFCAGNVSALERILDYQTDILIQRNGTLLITEKITVNAEHTSIRRGIYRDFPTIYHLPDGTRYQTTFDIIDVKRNGQSEPYYTEKRSNGIRVYIGDKRQYVTKGEHTYELVYKTDRQIQFFEHRDELYFNAISHGFIFPIEKATARLTLPTDANITEFTAYNGRQDSQTSDVYIEQPLPFEVRYTPNKSLDAYEGMTIVAAWNKGVILPPSRSQTLHWWFLDHLTSLLALISGFIVFIFLLVRWHFVGRDPAPGTIIPLFTPPEGLSPAACQYIYDHKMKPSAFTAATINMAVKGYLSIKEADATGGFQLHRLARSHHAEVVPLSAGEQKLATLLFSSGVESVSLGHTYDSKVQKAFSALKSSLKAEHGDKNFRHNIGSFISGVLLTLGLFVVLILVDNNAEAAGFGIFLAGLSASVVNGLRIFIVQRHRYRGLRLALRALVSLIPIFFAVFTFNIGSHLLNMFDNNGKAILLYCFVAGGLLALFYWLLKAPTMAGRKLMDQIEGFRLYLSVAEKDLLNFQHPPEKTPELFERYLPYAIALDVENEWGDQFTEIMEKAANKGRENLRWYHGRHGSHFSTMTSSLSGGLSSAIASSATPPSSSGSSGFSGGSSGGGGGGGGGGGW